MNFSDFVIYVDESGDHGLRSIDAAYPIFVLAFCIFRKTDYIEKVVPTLQAFKFKWFGHNLIVLHENEIVRRKPPFAFLQFDDIRQRFIGDLNHIVAQAPMTVIAAVIRKDALIRHYVKPQNPYQLALLFCLEKAHEFLRLEGAANNKTHVICEARSPRSTGHPGQEDQQLATEFQRIVAGRHVLQAPDRPGAMSCFDLVFASKQANSSGLQLADLIARPIGLSVLRPRQQNRAFEVIRSKIWPGAAPTPYLSAGLKIFP